MTNCKELYLWSSSHFRSNHLYPEETILPKFKRYSQFVFSKENIWSEGGQKLDEEMVDLMLKKIEDRGSSKQIHVIFFGDNNSRRGHEKPVDVMEHFERLANFVKDRPWVQIVLGSLIPSPQTDNYSKNIFKEFNSLIFQLTKSHSNIFFLNVTKYFLITKTHPRPMNKANARLFKKDKIHTNIEGAEILSELIFKKVYHLPNN